MVQLADLTPADIPEVMRIERLPGYETFVGRFEVEEHQAQFADPDACYFGVRDGERLAGFVIVQALSKPRVLLRRIAVDRPGAGVGTAMLRAVMDQLFETTPAEALELDVALGNPRAQHVYRREGFEPFGADDIHIYLAVPRSRWAAMRGR